jgi:hypothetical protein
MIYVRGPNTSSTCDYVVRAKKKTKKRKKKG